MIASDELRSWLGNPDEPGVTDLLEALEEMAVELFQDETGRFFGAEETRTEYIIGDGTRALHLNENPTAITSVGQRRLIGDSFQTITEGSSDGFELRAPESDVGRAKLLRKAGLGWADGYEHRVVYEFGYATGLEPLRIRQAVMDLVALKYHGRGHEGLQTFAAAGVAWKQFDANDILQVPGLARTLKAWRVRRMVLQ